MGQLFQVLDYRLCSIAGDVGHPEHMGDNALETIFRLKPMGTEFLSLAPAFRPELRKALDGVGFSQKRIEPAKDNYFLIKPMHVKRQKKPQILGLFLRQSSSVSDVACCS